MVHAGTIQEALFRAGLPIEWVQCLEPGIFLLRWKTGATGEQKAQGEAIAQALMAAEAMPEPQWKRLEDALRATSIFSKAFSTSNSNAWSLLMSALTRVSDPKDPGRLADFQWAIAQVRAGLSEDFSPEEINQFNQLLADCQFGFLVQ